MSDRLLHMGRVGKPHGIRGQVTADWFGEYLPEAGATILLKKSAGAAKPFIAQAISNHKGRLLLTLAGVADRNAAAELTGSEIFLPRDAIAPLAENEAFLADLPGFTVMLEDGSIVGKLDHLEYPPGQIIWAIKAADGCEMLFPARPEFIKTLSVSQKKAIIAPPPDLLDICRA